MINLTDDNFDLEVDKLDTPIVIDFYANWCGPCKAIAPIIEEISEQYKGKLTVLKANVDECSGIAQESTVDCWEKLFNFFNSKFEIGTNRRAFLLFQCLVEELISKNNRLRKKRTIII